MIPILKLMLALATVLGVVLTTVNSIPPKGPNWICDGNFEKNQLQNTAQEALNAIHSTRTLSASNVLADRGQHVFNNGLLKLHRKVLEDLQKDMGDNREQMRNLMENLMENLIPLSQPQQDAIGNMVAHFSPKDEYVDYNAVVYGGYAEKLRKELVKYLMADIFDKEDERNRIKTQVQLITHEMVNREVYVDPMACDHWLKKNQNHVQLYYDVKDALKKMIQNMLEDFKEVSQKIKDFHQRNN